MKRSCSVVYTFYWFHRHTFSMKFRSQWFNSLILIHKICSKICCYHHSISDPSSSMFNITWVDYLIECVNSKEKNRNEVKFDIRNVPTIEGKKKLRVLYVHNNIHRVYYIPIEIKEHSSMTKWRWLRNFSFISFQFQLDLFCSVVTLYSISIKARAHTQCTSCTYSVCCTSRFQISCSSITILVGNAIHAHRARIFPKGNSNFLVQVWIEFF